MSVYNYIMQLTRNLPIRIKLLFITLVTTNAALFLAGATIVIYDRQSQKQNLAEEIGVLIRVIAQRSTAALTFEDKRLATENLQALSEDSTILSACIYSADKKLFSEYYITASSIIKKCQGEGFDDATGFMKRFYQTYQEIKLDDYPIGYIYINASLDNIHRRMIDFIVFIGLTFFAASFLAFLLSFKLQGLITRPIDELVRVSRNIYVEKDYSIRVKKITNDEVGNLVDAFNDMLSGIEKRDIALVDAKENLESLVKERTHKLKEAQDDLVRNERMATLGKLTETVSHEIRNPLGTIRTSIFTLSNKLKSKQPWVIKIIDRIERNIIRCDNIITELLDFSRIRALQHERTNLCLWLRGILTDIAIPEPVNMILELNNDIDVEIDRYLLRRVIINVIENGYQAIDGHKSAGNTLYVQCVATELRTEIVVTDTGVGISEDVLPHIFEPLYSTKGFGIGLGLSIVKQIMEQHGGGIEITSEKNIGTKVVLWLPSTLSFSKKVAL